MKNFKSVIAVALIFSVLFSNGVYAEELFKVGKPAMRTLNTNAVFTDVLNQNNTNEVSTNTEASAEIFEKAINESPVAVTTDENSVSNVFEGDIQDGQNSENIDLNLGNETIGRSISRKNKDSLKEDSDENSLDNSFTVQGLVLPDIPAYSEDDIILLAKLIWHESEGEPREGKIAVGEVVLNRINSTIYPDTVNDVIYQKGQFSHVKYVANENPDAETVQIAEDVLNHGLKILNNAEVLYFRNPMKTSKVPASTEKNWGRHKYFTYYGNHAFYIHTPKKYSPFEKISGKKSKKSESVDTITETPDIIVENQNVIPVVVDGADASSDDTAKVADYSTFDTPLMIVVEGGPVAENNPADAINGSDAVNNGITHPIENVQNTTAMPVIPGVENVIPVVEVKPEATPQIPVVIQNTVSEQPVITVQPTVEVLPVIK